MAKTNIGLIIIILAISGAAIYYFGHNAGLFAVTGVEASTRTVPTQVAPGATFTVTYTTAGIAPPVTLLVDDVITGGCTAGGLTEIKDLLIIKAGSTTNSLTYNIVAPASGSCVFSGHYAFGNAANVNYPSATVTICSPNCDWTGATYCTLTKADGCGGTCTRTQPSVCTNIPTDACTATWADTCGKAGACTRAVIKNTAADVNCDNKVGEDELKTFANKWISNLVGETELKLAAQAWING
jgi:hypothetical protein